jgi:hypothetical protein
MPLRETVQAGAAKAPSCEHGKWQFAGSDYGRKATNWRCPKPASRWIRAERLHPLIPRQTPRWWMLYNGRTAGRARVWATKERVVAATGSLLPLCVRGLERVALHADLCTLVKLACALARARAVALAWSPLYNKLLAPQSKPVRLGPSPRPCVTHFRWLFGLSAGILAARPARLEPYSV